MQKQISKVLIANRGEIALRIVRACKEMGIKSVVVFSEVDIDGLWVVEADECYPILGNAIDAYLKFDRIISLAKKSNCDAIHPGYGFLSESAEFAKTCEDNGLIFIGPKPDHIALFGDKMASKVAMKEIGVPVLEGTNTPIDNVKDGAKIAKQIGFPVIIKAAFGGGGRGMRIVRREKEFAKMFEAASNESQKYFGRSEVFIEKYVQNPRHIEVQIVADKYGNVIHLGERDCSIQRRHQKVIEISPSPSLSEKTRNRLFSICVDAMKKLGYESVGTVEFLVDSEENAYFIEMNTRVQVEHPVTEMTSGIDIIAQMIDIASGNKLQYQQEDIKLNGYAIEFRINSENPKKDFFPTTGTITRYITPGGLGVRIDSALYDGYTLPTSYDSMIGKLIVFASTWQKTVNKAKRALDELIIDGVVTNISLHKDIVKEDGFINGTFDTSYLDKNIAKFELDLEHFIDKKESHIDKIKYLIKKIKEYKIQVRY